MTQSRKDKALLEAAEDTDADMCRGLLAATASVLRSTTARSIARVRC
jgi:sulfur transfer protein SufE